MSTKLAWMLGFASVWLIPTAGIAWAEDETPAKPETAAKAKEKPEGEAAKKKDIFAIPKDATAEQLMESISTLMRTRPMVRSREELIAHFTKVAEVMIERTSKVLEMEGVKDDVAVEALSARFEALSLQQQLGIEGTEKAELELAKKFADDKREPLAKIAKEKLLMAQLKNLKDFQPEEQQKLLADAVALVKGDGKLDQQALRMAMSIGSILEDAENPELAASAYEQFSALFATSENEQIARIGEKMTGIARRVKLVGNPVEIDGALVNGEAFDWSAYKGKVVLVDFWATWCGPCIQELPNVKSNYMGYHSKGFDVVGISLDDDKEQLENFIAKNHLKWSNLFGTKEGAMGWDHPLATRYGVMGIPFTILVGKDGNVIAMNVRGPALRKKLEELLGAPDEEAVKAALAEEEAAEKADSKDEKEQEDKDSDE